MEKISNKMSNEQKILSAEEWLKENGYVPAKTGKDELIDLVNGYHNYVLSVQQPPIYVEDIELMAIFAYPETNIHVDPMGYNALMRKAWIKGYTEAMQNKQKEAVEFVEWILTTQRYVRGSCTSSKYKWWDDTDNKSLTTDELYTLYQQNKKL